MSKDSSALGKPPFQNEEDDTEELESESERPDYLAAIEAALEQKLDPDTTLIGNNDSLLEAVISELEYNPDKALDLFERLLRQGAAITKKELTTYTYIDISSEVNDSEVKESEYKKLKIDGRYPPVSTNPVKRLVAQYYLGLEEKLEKNALHNLQAIRILEQLSDPKDLLIESQTAVFAELPQLKNKFRPLYISPQPAVASAPNPSGPAARSLPRMFSSEGGNPAKKRKTEEGPPSPGYQ